MLPTASFPLALPLVPALGLTATAADGELVLHLSGPLVTGSSAALSAWLLRHLPVSTGRLVLDLSGVGEVDAAGLGALLAARRRVRAGGQVVVAGAAPEVAAAMTRAGMTGLLPLVDDALLHAA